MKLRFLFCLALAGCTGLSQAAAPSSVTLEPTDKIKGPLLYLGDEQFARVYAYPRGKLAGTIKQDSWIYGICSNPVTGDVFFVLGEILEYAHGGWTPIKTLAYPGGAPQSCAVDPGSGDLAVTDSLHPEVFVYTRGSGTPKDYANLPGFDYAVECVYDDRGNLYVTGRGVSTSFALDEITKRGRALTVALASTPTSPSDYAGVLWDGTHVVLSDGAQNLYQFEIAAGKGRLTGQVTLEGAAGVAGMWLQGSELIVPNNAQDVVQFYSYPAGGVPIKTLSGFLYPRGAAVSVAPK